MKNKSLAQQLKNIFLRGFFVLLPIALTIFLMVYLFDLFDSMLGSIISRWFNVDIPGLGILVAFILIFLVGILVSNVVGNSISKFIEWLLARIPFIKTLYMPLKDVIKSISGENKTKSFRKVVFVEFPLQGTHSIGFVTNEAIMVGDSKKEAVFIPTTPNPTNGFLIYVDAANYTELDMSVDIALRTIVSLGTVSPEALRSKSEQ